jgi:hypothetical protein
VAKSALASIYKSFLLSLILLPVSLLLPLAKHCSAWKQAGACQGNNEHHPVDEKRSPLNTGLAESLRRSTIALSLAATLAALVFSASPIAAQSPALQARLAEIKQASAANKQALSHYTWQESQTTSIKGEVKKQQLFQVSVGPNGQQQKSEINAQPAAAPSGGMLKRHIVAKKKAEFKDYGEQIADLARQYTRPDPGSLQNAFQQGNISLQLGGDDSQVTLIIKNYLKQNDSVTLVFDKRQKAIQRLRISTYLDDPKDAVTISAQFAKLPDGTNHVSGTQINGVSKQLTVVTQNSNYQRL